MVKSGVQIVREQTHDMGQYTSMSGLLGLTGHYAWSWSLLLEAVLQGTKRHP